MDELFETATLVQTKKVTQFPIVLMGTDFWGPLLGFVRHTMIAAGTISPEDPDLIAVTDDPEAAVRIVRDYAAVVYPPKPAPILGESTPRKQAAKEPQMEPAPVGPTE
jgi:predicted Rossmann-fold nucleotide-binding protein